jgi:hypothetical protein
VLRALRHQAEVRHPGDTSRREMVPGCAVFFSHLKIRNPRIHPPRSFTNGKGLIYFYDYFEMASCLFCIQTTSGRIFHSAREHDNEGGSLQKAGFRAAFVCLPFAGFKYITQNSLEQMIISYPFEYAILRKTAAFSLENGFVSIRFDTNFVPVFPRGRSAPLRVGRNET